MPYSFDILVTIKYLIASAIFVMIVMTPAWLACQTKKDKKQSMKVRLGSWLFLWTGIGWLIALYWAAKK